jgi:uncharacterized protein YecT (DUF1311 family)
MEKASDWCPIKIRNQKRRCLSGTLVGIATIAMLLGGCGASSQGKSSETPDTLVSTDSTESNAAWKISATGLGPIQFGMTLQAVREALEPGQNLTPESNVMVDWDGLALKDQDTPLFYILYPHGTALADSDRVELLLVADPAYTTAEGIGSGSTIAEAEAAYGKATLSYNVDDEMREYVRFANAPANLGFRTTGSPDQWVGQYQGSADGSYYETQDFNPEGKIKFILVDGSTVQADTPADVPNDATQPNQNNPQEIAGNPETSAIDCTNAATTLEINACAKQSYDAADRILNEVYQQVRQELDGTSTNTLLTVQQDWLKFRDAHCNQFSQAFVGGTAYPSFLQGCLTQTTENRIGYLRQELDIFAKERPPTALGSVTVDGQTLDCDNPVGTPVVKYCAQLAYAQSDRTLNEVYQTLTARLDAPGKAALTEVQLTWLEYRDRHCEFATREAVGGTGYEGYRNNCLEDLTRDRTAQLQLQLDR